MINTDFLKNVQLFSNLSEEELVSISKEAEVKQYEKDVFICKEGEKADAMFIIKSGIVQIFCDDGAGGRKVLSHLKLGEYFGEMALLTDEPRNASSVALGDAEVIMLTKESFHKLLNRYPAVSLSIIKTLCARLSKTNLGTGRRKLHQTYSIIGPDTSSGKSLFARNLALAMQKELGKDVLLYDPNVRDDKVAKMLGVEERSDIIDELVEREQIKDISKYIAKTPSGLLTVIPQENGLTDVRLKEFHTFSLMQSIAANFEFVVIDSSLMQTRITNEIMQNSDKIIYLISSKNVSITGLIEHFDATRQNWKIKAEKVIIGVNHLTDDVSQESLITDKDKERISFEIPFAKELVGVRDARIPLVEAEPTHPLAQIATKQAQSILYSESIGLLIPTFNEEPAKAALALRWMESGESQFPETLKNIKLSETINRDGEEFKLLTGRTSNWELNDLVVKFVDFANKFKKEFRIDGMVLLLNGQESLI